VDTPASWIPPPYFLQAPPLAGAASLIKDKNFTKTTPDFMKFRVRLELDRIDRIDRIFVGFLGFPTKPRKFNPPLAEAASLIKDRNFMNHISVGSSKSPFRKGGFSRAYKKSHPAPL